MRVLDPALEHAADFVLGAASGIGRWRSEPCPEDTYQKVGLVDAGALVDAALNSAGVHSGNRLRLPFEQPQRDAGPAPHISGLQ